MFTGVLENKSIKERIGTTSFYLMESLCLRNPKLTNCMHSLIHFSPWGCWVGLAKEVIFPLCCQKEKLLDFFLSVKICRSRKVNSRRLSTKQSIQMSCQRDHSSNKWEQILKAKMRSQSRFWEQRNVRTWSTWAGHRKKCVIVDEQSRRCNQSLRELRILKD